MSEIAPTKKCNKPTLCVMTYYEYNDLIKYIEEKYSIRVRDYAGHFEHYSRFLKIVNKDRIQCPLKGTIPDEEYNLLLELNHKQYQEYKAWIMIPGNEEPPYLDFWHWLLKQYEGQIYNGCVITFGWKYYHDDSSTPDWVKEIIKFILDEFPDQDEMCCYVGW